MVKITEAFNKLKADKKLFLLVCIGLCGVVLLIASFLNKGETSSHDADDAESLQISHTDYAQAIEQKLTDIISSVDGAGNTIVMVTLENGEEQVYAVQENTKNSSTSDGDKKVASRDVNNEYIIIENDGEENGLILKVIQPKIRGVAIVCEGADRATVKQSITELVTAVLGIGSNRVNISKIAG